MTFEDHLDPLVRLFDQGKYVLTAHLAGSRLQDSPEDGRLLELYGTACWNAGLDGALDALEQASALVPLHPLAQFALAGCYAQQGKPDLACLLYEHLGNTADSTRLLSAVAARLGEMGRCESALLVCRRITTLNPAHHPAHFGVAFYLCRLGRPPEDLIPHLATALDLAPAVHQYRVSLAFAWNDVGRCTEAADLLAPVPLESVRCACQLARMQAIFERAGRSCNAQACRARLDGSTQ